MDYKLSEVQNKIQQFADKMGSDYFPLPVILNHFETATLKFVGEKLKLIEKTQEVVDDIRRLIVPGKLTIARDDNDATRWVAGLPVDYMRAIAYDIFYKDGSRCRRADVKRHAERSIISNDPNQQPNKNYPAIYQENNLFQIDCGSASPDYMKITYCKKPTFATTGQPDSRIVNLSDEAIENILLTTVTQLFNSTADERIQSNYQLEEAFRKILK